MKDILETIEGFEWDSGNAAKNWLKHGVSREECEEVFFLQPLVISEDRGHSQQENRYRVLGHTRDGRRLFLVFTLRSRSIRIISARDMNRSERNVYENIKKNPEFQK